MPLENIDTETVAKALLYSRLGIPKEVLSFLGTQLCLDILNTYALYSQRNGRSFEMLSHYKKNMAICL